MLKRDKMYYCYRFVVNRYNSNRQNGYYIDSMYSMKAQSKRTAANLARITDNLSDTSYGSKITVIDFLNEIKDYYGNDLSDDVNSHLGRTKTKSNIDGLLYQDRNTEISNRKIFPTALKISAIMRVNEQ